MLRGEVGGVEEDQRGGEPLGLELLREAEGDAIDGGLVRPVHVAHVAAGIEGGGRGEEERKSAAGVPRAHGVLGEGLLGAAEDEGEESLSGGRTAGLLLDEPGEAEFAIGGDQRGRETEGEGGQLAPVENLLLDLLEALEELVGGAEVEIEGDADRMSSTGRLPEIIVNAAGLVLPGPDEGHEGSMDTTLIRQSLQSTV